ncbi:Leucine-rich repeat-containing protein 9 [Irineochytrium annulatum]|nr:Leucine-rich repeat-containing protein 9 [Irineochytrium annulatum]
MWLHNFPFITSLCLVAQEISELTGLADCPNLEQLWTLTALKDLQIGNNKITSIGDSLKDNLSLQELNIAGNRLSSFRDVLYLARLPKLTSLCLSDPNYADNPICSLCNYQTHVIYHLPNLRSLDTLEVTDESRRIISATVLKKRMYYNMRIRTIKRNTNFLTKMLQTRNVEEEKILEEEVITLMRKSRIIQKKRDDLGLPPPGPEKSEAFSGISEQLEDARFRVNSLIESKMRTLLSLQNHKKDVANQISQQSDMAIRKLLLELETGGNVRFEDDQRDDSWFETSLESRSDDIFQAVEHGFYDIRDSESGLSGNGNSIMLSNYLEFADVDGEMLFSANVGRDRKRLRQAIIVKTFANKVQMADDEYFVEYSLESDLDRFTTRVERLMVDIAYSNKLSQADMPAIVIDVIGKITETAEILLRKTAGSVDSINLSMAVSAPVNLEPFHQFTNLRHLTLSHCKLTEIPSIRHLPRIENLDLSFNAITVITSGLATASLTLRNFDLASNLITFMDSVRHVLEALKALQSLDLRFNPICSRKGYRQYVISSTASKTFKTLDGVPFEDGEKGGKVWRSSGPGSSLIGAEGESGGLAFISEHSSTQPHLFRPLSVRTQSGYGSSAAQNEYWRIARLPQEGPITVNVEAITTMELDSCNLMIHLRWASFRNNNLRDLSRLSLFPRLEELSLENNEIEHIDPLVSLLSLTKLDVSNNRVATMEITGNFRSLMLLSLENNLIKCLKAVSKMPTLMELYIGNNYIADLYSIFPLKELPRLIILDLTGNAVCQVYNYRLFSIFHLSRLKILDGASITTKEQASAKEVYLGKLTVELLGEKIGHFSFRNISELDLRNCKIREIDCFNTGEFRSIRKLNFDNNILSNIDPFLNLIGLRSLSVNSNRLDRLVSTDGPAIMSANGWRIESPDISKMKVLLPLLEELHLGYNTISRIADLGLYRLPQLKVLHLHGNRISKVGSWVWTYI